MSTPGGFFFSVGLAADAFGIAHSTASYRARWRLFGWRYVAALGRSGPLPPLPKRKRRFPYAHLKDRERHPRNRAVITPEGCFASAALAAEAFGITRAAAAYRAKNAVHDWHYADDLT